MNKNPLVVSVTLIIFIISLVLLSSEKALLSAPTLEICTEEEAKTKDELMKDRFASFYNPVEYSSKANIEGYGLPLDLDEVQNYASVAGKLGLGEAEELIKANGFTVIPHWKREDDIVEAYKDIKDWDIPVFVTSDSLLHLYHIQFDETLKDIEEREFYKDMVSLTRALLEKSKEQYEYFNGDLKEAARRNVAFFSVGLKVLCRDLNEPVNDLNDNDEKEILINSSRLIMSRVEETSVDVIAVDFNELIPGYVRDVVGKEIEFIEAHQGFTESPLFIYKEDYSQYVPRGHYTRSEALKRYFKGLMWYGRMTFLLKGNGYWGPYNFQDALISLEDANIQTMQAALIVKNVNDCRADERRLVEIWDRIYTVTAYYVGLSDDLTIYEYREEINGIFGQEYDPIQLNDIEKLFDLREKLALLRSPEIYGGTGECRIFVPPGERLLPEELDEILDKTKGMRLMGQRFIPDSYIMQRMVAPIVGGLEGEMCFTTSCDENQVLFFRGFPRGLDVMGILGSERAREILDETGDSQYEGYDKSFNELKEEFEAFTEEEWNKNLYWSWLYSLKALLKKAEPGYQTFMQTKAWTDKQLNACLASWAELRHDTILYAKQSYTPVVVTSLPPDVIPKRVVGYVEPVPEFYARLIALTKMTLNGLESMNVLDQRAKRRIEDLNLVLERLLAIAEKELANEELTEEDYDFIEFFGKRLESVVLDVSEKGTSTVLVADVHTDCNKPQRVLEEGIGYVKIIAVCYKVPDGRILMGAGPTLSYYEFKQPISQRLTDEKWKAMLTSGDEPPFPEWNNSFDIDAYRAYGPPKSDFDATNHAPVAMAKASVDAGWIPFKVSFSSQGSYDPDGDKITFLWDFGDGSLSNDPNPIHLFAEEPVSQEEPVPPEKIKPIFRPIPGMGFITEIYIDPSEETQPENGEEEERVDKYVVTLKVYDDKKVVGKTTIEIKLDENAKLKPLPVVPEPVVKKKPAPRIQKVKKALPVAKGRAIIRIVKFIKPIINLIPKTAKKIGQVLSGPAINPVPIEKPMLTKKALRESVESAEPSEDYSRELKEQKEPDTAEIEVIPPEERQPVINTISIVNPDGEREIIVLDENGGLLCTKVYSEDLEGNITITITLLDGTIIEARQNAETQEKSIVGVTEPDGTKVCFEELSEEKRKEILDLLATGLM